MAGYPKRRLMSPLAIRFSEGTISPLFQDGTPLESTLSEMLVVPISPHLDSRLILAPFREIEVYRVVVMDAPYEAPQRPRLCAVWWVTDDSRRLCCLQRIAAAQLPFRCQAIVKVMNDVPIENATFQRVYDVTRGLRVQVSAHPYDPAVQMWKWTTMLERCVPDPVQAQTVVANLQAEADRALELLDESSVGMGIVSETQVYVTEWLEWYRRNREQKRGVQATVGSETALMEQNMSQQAKAVSKLQGSFGGLSQGASAEARSQPQASKSKISGENDSLAALFASQLVKTALEAERQSVEAERSETGLSKVAEALPPAASSIGKAQGQEILELALSGAPSPGTTLAGASGPSGGSLWWQDRSEKGQKNGKGKKPGSKGYSADAAWRKASWKPNDAEQGDWEEVAQAPVTHALSRSGKGWRPVEASRDASGEESIVAGATARHEKPSLWAIHGEWWGNKGETYVVNAEDGICFRYTPGQPAAKRFTISWDPHYDSYVWGSGKYYIDPKEFQRTKYAKKVNWYCCTTDQVKFVWER